MSEQFPRPEAPEQELDRLKKAAELREQELQQAAGNFTHYTAVLGDLDQIRKRIFELEPVAAPQAVPNPVPGVDMADAAGAEPIATATVDVAAAQAPSQSVVDMDDAGAGVEPLDGQAKNGGSAFGDIPDGSAAESLNFSSDSLETARTAVLEKKKALEQYEGIMGGLRSLINSEAREKLEIDYREAQREYDMQLEAIRVYNSVTEWVGERMKTLNAEAEQRQDPSEKNLLERGYRALGNINLKGVAERVLGIEADDTSKRALAVRMVGSFMSARTAVSLGLLGAGVFGSGGVGALAALAAMRMVGGSIAASDVQKMGSAAKLGLFDAEKVAVKNPGIFDRIKGVARGAGSALSQIKPEEIQRYRDVVKDLRAGTPVATVAPSGPMPAINLMPPAGSGVMQQVNAARAVLDDIESKLADLESSALLYGHNKELVANSQYQELLAVYGELLAMSVGSVDVPVANLAGGLSLAIQDKLEDKRLRHQGVVVMGGALAGLFRANRILDALQGESVGSTNIPPEERSGVENKEIPAGESAAPEKPAGTDTSTQPDNALTEKQIEQAERARYVRDWSPRLDKIESLFEKNGTIEFDQLKQLKNMASWSHADPKDPNLNELRKLGVDAQKLLQDVNPEVLEKSQISEMKIEVSGSGGGFYSALEQHAAAHPDSAVWKDVPGDTPQAKADGLFQRFIESQGIKGDIAELRTRMGAVGDRLFFDDKNGELVIGSDSGRPLGYVEGNPHKLMSAYGDNTPEAKLVNLFTANVHGLEDTARLTDRFIDVLKNDQSKTAFLNYFDHKVGVRPEALTKMFNERLADLARPEESVEHRAAAQFFKSFFHEHRADLKMEGFIGAGTEPTQPSVAPIPPASEAPTVKSPEPSPSPLTKPVVPPSPAPTPTPSEAPTAKPTATPTASPSAEPTPTVAPSQSPAPIEKPTPQATETPTSKPSAAPAEVAPTETPSPAPKPTTLNEAVPPVGEAYDMPKSTVHAENFSQLDSSQLFERVLSVDQLKKLLPEQVASYRAWLTQQITEAQREVATAGVDSNTYGLKEGYAEHLNKLQQKLRLLNEAFPLKKSALPMKSLAAIEARIQELSNQDRAA